MGSVPVAQIDINAGVDTLSYLHTDHLGTPHRATSEAGDVVWSWDSDAFGKTAASNDPEKSGVSTIINLRFPGQYYDAETALHYNHFRNYDSSSGRYVTSDPIGLNGGLNTYGYVGGNPVGGTDFYGLRGPGPCTGTSTPGIGTGTLIGSSEDFINSPPPALPYPYTLDDIESPSLFVGRNGNLIMQDGSALSCNIDDRDRCRDLLMRIYKHVYGKKKQRGSNTLGIAIRYNQQLLDPGNFMY